MRNLRESSRCVCVGKKLEGKNIFFWKNRSDAVRLHIERKEGGWGFVMDEIELDFYLSFRIERRSSIFFSSWGKLGV